MLDYERMLLVLKIDPRVPGPIPGFDFRGHRRVRMHESEGFNLYVDGSVNGKAARLMVDTGAFATLLHSPFRAPHEHSAAPDEVQIGRGKFGPKPRAACHYFALVRRLDGYAEPQRGRDQSGTD